MYNTGKQKYRCDAFPGTSSLPQYLTPVNPIRVVRRSGFRPFKFVRLVRLDMLTVPTMTCPKKPIMELINDF